MTQETNDELVPDEAGIFNDHGTLYLYGRQSPEEWLYMENRPDTLENKC